MRDIAADRINRPDTRPLAAGALPKDTANLLVFLGTLLGLVCAALVSGRQVVAAVAALAVMFVYSPFLKPRPLIGNLAVALVAGSPPFYGALAVGLPAAGVVPWILAAWLHFVREVVKDVEDEAGDRAIGRRASSARSRCTSRRSDRSLWCTADAFGDWRWMSCAGNRTRCVTRVC